MSRKLLSTILLLCFLISACASPAPAPTATATLIPPTRTPTATATLTPVPTVTFTPAPSLPSAVVADVEASLPGYTLQGTTHGDQLIDPEGRVVPEMMVIPHKFGVDGDKGWLVERDYKFDGKPFTIYMQKDDIKVMPNDGLDMPALQYIDGQLKPKFVIHKDYASGVETETKYQLISLQEAIQKVFNASVATYKRSGTYDRTRKPSEAARVLNLHNKVMILDGVTFPINFNVPKGGFAIGIWNEISFINVKTNEAGWAGTIPYYWVSVEDGKYNYFGFVNDKGEIDTYFIDNGNLNVDGYSKVDIRAAHPFIMFILNNIYY